MPYCFLFQKYQISINFISFVSYSFYFLCSLVKLFRFDSVFSSLPFMILILFYLFSFLLLPKCDFHFCDGFIYLPPPHFFQLYRCHYFIKFSEFQEDFFKILTSFMAMDLRLFFFLICFCYLFIKACCFNPMIVPLKKIMIKKKKLWLICEWGRFFSSALHWTIEWFYFYTNLSLLWLFIMIHIYSQQGNPVVSSKLAFLIKRSNWVELVSTFLIYFVHWLYNRTS